MSRVKSVLLVDFDNIYGAAGEDFATSISHWLRWLEDGALSAGNRRRHFVNKRVYWNLQFDIYRPAFEAAGFEAFNCRALAKRKISAGKSSADIVITMDAMEVAMNTRGLEELIVLTTDSDFVPVVNRVQKPQLRVVTAGKETDPTYDLFSQHADAVIHIGALKAAFTYERAPRKWYRLRSPPPEIAPVANREVRDSPLVGRLLTALGAERDAATSKASGVPPEIAKAADVVAELGGRTPDQPLSRNRIVRALAIVPGFSQSATSGQRPWLGAKNYAAMMRRLAQVRDEIEVRPMGSGRIEVIVRVRTPARAVAASGA